MEPPAYKIFNLLSTFMQWFLSAKTIVIEKIVRSNTKQVHSVIVYHF
jgi:hypothetical protein